RRSLVHRAALLRRREEGAALRVARRGRRQHMPQGFDDRGRGARSPQPPRAAGVRRLPAALDGVLRRSRRRVRLAVLDRARRSRARHRGLPIMKRFFAAFALFAVLAAIRPVAQQAPATTTDGDKKDEGIPVTSALVRQKCSSCHRADDQGRMTRISYRRSTPEGWEETIKRMVSLNDVKLEPSDAREILRYLA